MGKIIGIDLGTTNSCCAVVENGEPVIIPSQSGARTTPSIVAFTKLGERLVGENAKRQMVANPTRTVTSVKRYMGSDWHFKVDDKDYKAPTVSAMILMQIKKDAEAFLGQSVNEAVITVPAYFNDAQRQATKDAGRIAGLTVKRIINEPTSAALSYGLNHGEPQKVMVYDLGGGTFDVSIIEIGEGVIEVLATAGNNHLGGDDFDKRIVEYLVAEFKKEHGIDLNKDYGALRRVTEAAEQAKKELSTTDTTNIELPYIAMTKNGPVHMQKVLTRAKFEQLVMDLIKRTEGPVRTALADAGISSTELKKVLLVGGSSRIPAVQTMVRNITRLEPSRNINSDECVAMGAAILGSTLEGNALTVAGSSDGLLLLDVAPLSLSIETVGGMATRLIERNTTLPTKHTRVFTTAAAYQKDVIINVLQGERPLARENKSIGKFKLKGIKRAPAGVPQIEVTFDIDANGIVKVSARDLDTMREQSITISDNGNMSEEDIRKAIFDAQENAGFDQMKRDANDLINESRVLVSKADQQIKALGKSLNRNEKKIVKASCMQLERSYYKINLAKITDEQVANIQAAKSQLEQDCRVILRMEL